MSDSISGHAAEIRARYLEQKTLKEASLRRFCEQCAASFLPTRPHSRYCSLACQREHANALARAVRSNARQCICGQCGETFTARRSDGRYCSGACRQKSYRKRYG